MSAEPVRFVIRMPAKPGRARELREYLNDLVDELKMEEECLGAWVWQDARNSDVVGLEEHWMSVEAHDAFLAAAAEAGILDTYTALMSGPMTTQAYIRT